MSQHFNSAKETEIHLFNQVAPAWWSTTGPFRLLHEMNFCRLAYIKNHIVNCFAIKDDLHPFNTLNILDIGCGGGILCEPLARLGANVTGIDASAEAIGVAQDHAQKSALNINYRVQQIESLPLSEKFDVITALELVEHVAHVDLFLQKCIKHLKPGGLLFISTINQTWKSYLGAIVGAEYILRLVPVGTHHFHQFVKPYQLYDCLSQNETTLIDLKGLRYSFLKKEWYLSSDTKMNYILCAQLTKN